MEFYSFTVSLIHERRIATYANTNRDLSRLRIRGLQHRVQDVIEDQLIITEECCLIAQDLRCAVSPEKVGAVGRRFGIRS